MTVDLAKARALCEAVTPGPWENVGSIPAGSRTVLADADAPVPTVIAQKLEHKDAAFIASARTLLPEALDEIERLRAENARLLAFAGAVLDLPDSSDVEIDVDSLNDLFLEHGLRVQVEATEADCAEEWAQEWGLEPGDPIHRLTDLGRRAREARQ